MASVALKEDIERVLLDRWEGDPEQKGKCHQVLVDEFEDLYITYRSRVWALCLRMTGNPDDAEDLTQETFVRMFRKLDTFRGESEICTWLRRIAMNVVLQRFQKASWRRETPLEEVTSQDPVCGCPHKVEFGRVDTRLHGAIDRIRLQRAINQLPPGFRAVLILHDIEGYEHVEISELMGCTVGTSKSQLHKARLKMRELLHQTSLELYGDHRHADARTVNTYRAKKPTVLLFSTSAPRSYAAAGTQAA
ncbi:MAG TPA: RNA polymerase sigma factor [Terriglobia bacterium]|nr:RNA polymerase sigma factor [Terriglobia bacterium]